jgi:hypothetical protein
MRTLSVSLAALLLSAGTANATPSTTIAGSTSITSTDTSGVVSVSNLLANFSFNLAVGGSTTLNVLSLTPDPGNGTNTYNFTITDSFTFASPGTGSYGDQGSGTIQVEGHAITGGGVTWPGGTNGTNISLPGGYVVNVNLSNPGFTGDSPRGGDSETVAATFTLVSGPTSVPEPGTMALLGAGLVGLGMVRRRAKA